MNGLRFTVKTLCLLCFRVFSHCFIVAIDIYNEINVLYGMVMDECTDEKCPKMSEGSKYVHTVMCKIRLLKCIWTISGLNTCGPMARNTRNQRTRQHHST